jgi:hypothetical protein
MFFSVCVLPSLYLLQAEKVDMLIGSVAFGLCSAGGFCAGSQIVVDHQVSSPLTVLPSCSYLSPLAYQRPIICLLRFHAGCTCCQCLRRHQHPSINTLHPHHAPRKHTSSTRNPRPHRLHHSPLASRLARHPHPHSLAIYHVIAPC